MGWLFVQISNLWVGNKNGEFTVRNAYHLTKGRCELEEGGCSNPQFTNTPWKAIWKLKVTRAFKLFIWKASSKIPPTKENLFERGITTNPMCSICGINTETVGHILWNCPSARDVWLDYPKMIQKCSSDDDAFINIFERDSWDGWRKMISNRLLLLHSRSG